MHLDEETIQRWLHAELEPGARSAWEGHLQDCPACRERLRAAGDEDRWVRDRIRSLAADAPVPEAAAIRRRARRLHRRRWAAAAALLVLSAGVAYAAPRLPVARWLAMLGARLAPSTRPAPLQPASGPGNAGIALRVEPRLVIRFDSAGPGSTARVALRDSGDITIRTRGVDASYTTRPGLLLISEAGESRQHDIELPRGAPWVAIESGSRRLLLKVGDRIETSGAESAGVFLVPLGRPSGE